ncbi:BCCT family transporter [Helcobacillus massiliensis]|uniref:BCCT family transporter n=1 Tax=Helcobacillus massiliensis TaxID=521392 RepID=UPI0021A57253|nr:BCCT family transporter [Helcobacillus massiliensis]MCT1557945.1 BCCT family transporter [Helcobacillus massiliensis]MCT2037344.1 BCCT family transporter [Helcobacillus massiliensis]MCT2332947.1 BCCT family transporter [Helcobacillus massiliensis]
MVPASDPAAVPRVGPNRPVFIVSAGTVVACAAFALLAPAAFNHVIGTINTAVIATIGWFYITIVAVFITALLIIALSRMGTVRLGRPGDGPDYAFRTWFAMLFAAGTGIGLVFWGAAEPLTFYLAKDGSMPPHLRGLADPERADGALVQSFFHWGLHSWSIFIIVALGIAYAAHRRGRPMAIRWALEPLLKERTDSWIGDIVDIVSIVATLFGIATSLGFGINQIAAGLEHLGIIGSSPTLKIVLILAITALATLSVASGIDRGIKILSNVNLGLAGVLLLGVFMLGPTLYLSRGYIAGIGNYITAFVPMTFQTLPNFGTDGADWLSGWTVYYWAWFISWAPFVGMFIARISKGRTVREFILGALFVPGLVSVSWFAIMGGAAIYQARFSGQDFLHGGNSVNADTAFFDILAHLPLGSVLSVITVVLVAIFFITSADSGAFVVDIMAHRGDPNPPRITRIVWALSSGIIAAALIGVASFHSGDTSSMAGLRAFSLLAALPFSLVMISILISLLKSLRSDVRRMDRLEAFIARREVRRVVADAVGPAETETRRPAAPASTGSIDIHELADRVAELQRSHASRPAAHSVRKDLS